MQTITNRGVISGLLCAFGVVALLAIRASALPSALGADGAYAPESLDGCAIEIVTIDKGNRTTLPPPVRYVFTISTVTLLDNNGRPISGAAQEYVYTRTSPTTGQLRSGSAGQDQAQMDLDDLTFTSVAGGTIESPAVRTRGTFKIVFDALHNRQALVQGFGLTPSRATTRTRTGTHSASTAGQIVVPSSAAATDQAVGAQAPSIPTDLTGKTLQMTSDVANANPGKGVAPIPSDPGPPPGYFSPRTHPENDWTPMKSAAIVGTWVVDQKAYRTMFNISTVDWCAKAGVAYPSKSAYDAAVPMLIEATGDIVFEFKADRTFSILFHPRGSVSEPLKEYTGSYSYSPVKGILTLLTEPPKFNHEFHAGPGQGGSFEDSEFNIDRSLKVSSKYIWIQKCVSIGNTLEVMAMHNPETKATVTVNPGTPGVYYLGMRHFLAGGGGQMLPLSRAP